MPLGLTGKPSRLFGLDGWWLTGVVYRQLEPSIESQPRFHLDPCSSGVIFAVTEEGIECQVDLDITPTKDYDSDAHFPDIELTKSLLLGLFDYFFWFNKWSLKEELERAVGRLEPSKLKWLNQKLDNELPIGESQNYKLGLPCNPYRLGEFEAYFGTPNRINISISHSEPVNRSIGDRQVAWYGYSETIELYSRYSYLEVRPGNDHFRRGIEIGAYLDRLESQFWDLEEISYTDLIQHGNYIW